MRQKSLPTKNDSTMQEMSKACILVLRVTEGKKNLKVLKMVRENLMKREELHLKGKSEFGQSKK